jgi:hypothetical protein
MLRDIEAPTISRCVHRWRCCCHSYSPEVPYSRTIPGTLLYKRLSLLKGHSAYGRIRPVEEFSNSM